MTEQTKIKYSNKLDLDRFFYHARDQIYVIVKPDGEFPNYYERSDIDIFCYDKDEFAKAILGVGNQYVLEGFEIVVADKKDSHTHIDFYFNGKLDFRFDLYESFPQYKKVQIKKHYIYSVIENAIPLDRDFDGERYQIYVPSVVDDLLLRYIEYIEWYEVRPDKIKHLDYIARSIEEDHGRISFLDRLHLYTYLPSARYDNSSNIVSAFRERNAYWIARIRSMPLRRIPGAVLRKLYRIILSVIRKVV
jgi:hypothetical protein